MRGCCPKCKEYRSIGKETGDLVKFNITAARIWELLNGTHTMRNIIETISSEFDDAEIINVKQDLKEFLLELENKKLISWRKGYIRK